MEENYKQLLRQRLQPVVLGGPDYEVSTPVEALFCSSTEQLVDAADILTFSEKLSD